jgi:hypothetical protein
VNEYQPVRNPDMLVLIHTFTNYLTYFALIALLTFLLFKSESNSLLHPYLLAAARHRFQVVVALPVITPKGSITIMENNDPLRRWVEA